MSELRDSPHLVSEVRSKSAQRYAAAGIHHITVAQNDKNSSMIQQDYIESDKNDPGYYTPKNILNPAMYRLAEITRALSEVNMEIDHEKMFEHPKNRTILDSIDYENKASSENELAMKKDGSTDTKNRILQFFRDHEEEIGKILISTLAMSIGLFLILLCLSWPE